MKKEIKAILAMLQEETNWNANMVRQLVVRFRKKGAGAFLDTPTVESVRSMILSFKSNNVRGQEPRFLPFDVQL